MIKKYIEKINPVIAILVGFTLIFVLDLLALYFFTDTSFVISCLLLVVEVGLAVALVRCNYGVLGLVAIAELIVGVISKDFLATFLSLIMYFITLIAIHLLRKYGGKKDNEE